MEKNVYILFLVHVSTSLGHHQGENVKHEIEITQVLRQTVSFILRNCTRR